MTSGLKPVTFQFVLLPILCLLILVIYGLIIRPLVLNLDQLPLEIIFITASVFTISQLVIKRHPWAEIQKSIVKKWQKPCRHGSFFFRSVSLLQAG